MQELGEDMVDLDIEVSNAVVLAKNGETPVEHGSSRRRILMLGDECAKQRVRKIKDVSPTKARVASGLVSCDLNRSYAFIFQGYPTSDCLSHYTSPRPPVMTDSRASVGIKSTINQIEDQEQRLSLSLGRGSSQSIIESARCVFTLAPRHPDYVKFDEVPFVYEKLGGRKLTMRSKQWWMIGPK